MSPLRASSQYQRMREELSVSSCHSEERSDVGIRSHIAFSRNHQASEAERCGKRSRDYNKFRPDG